MGSHKKESEGIALLSIYGDEDDDMEDQIHEDKSPLQNPQQTPEEQEREEESSFRDEAAFEHTTFEHTTTTTASVAIEEVTTFMSSDFASNDGSGVLIERQQEQILNENVSSTNYFNLRGSVTPRDFLDSPIQEQHKERGRLGIVDYGHDEAAMSPEAEDGEITANDQVMCGEEPATDNGDLQAGMTHVLTPGNQANPGQLSEHNDQLENDSMSDPMVELKSAEPEEVDMVPAGQSGDIDPLSKFLPPPPKAKCSERLQEKIIKFLNLKKSTGRSYNSEVRNRKEYRNPDFLLHAVTYQDIDQIGSCFSKDVFDPHGYNKSDYYDEIEADMRREMERKEQERKRSPKVDFMSGGTQPGTVIPTPKISIPIPGLPSADGGGINAAPASTDTVARDGRQNKKSKWDKNPLPTTGPEPVSAAALLSAANAGAGYSAFAQQRRREAEDRRSNEKKFERRT